jgi:hypothetical protein
LTIVLWLQNPDIVAWTMWPVPFILRLAWPHPGPQLDFCHHSFRPPGHQDGLINRGPFRKIS